MARFAWSIGRTRRDDSGSAAVEFALIAPALLILVVGGLIWAIYFGVANSVQQLAADAARASVAGLNDDERRQMAMARVASSVRAYALLNPEMTTVIAVVPPEDSSVFRVSVSYDASRLGIWAFRGLVPLPAETIVRSASIQRGGF